MKNIFLNEQRHAWHVHVRIVCIHNVYTFEKQNVSDTLYKNSFEFTIIKYQLMNYKKNVFIKICKVDKKKVL